MSERITITVAAGGDDAEARAFSAALQDILDILDSLVADQLGKGQAVTWRIVAMSKSSPPKITLECRRNVAVAKRFVAGWNELQKAPANPFPPRAMRATRRLGRRMTRGQLDSVVVESPGIGSVVPTPQIAENADRALSAKYYTIPSSVEGKLDIVNVRTRQKFSVFDDTYTRETRCTFPQDMLDEVKRNLGKRVLVVGNVKHDAATDRPISIAVESIEPIDDDPVKPLLFSEMQAINLIGDSTSDEHVRRLRDGR